MADDDSSRAGGGLRRGGKRFVTWYLSGGETPTRSEAWLARHPVVPDRFGRAALYDEDDVLHP